MKFIFSCFLICVVLSGCDFIERKGPVDPRSPVVLVRSGGESGTAFMTGTRGGELFLLTAAHVIQDPQDIALRFFTNQEAQGKLVNSDLEMDLALIRCPLPPGLADLTSFPPLGDQAALDTDEDVIIVGHPFGNEWDINRANKVKAKTYGVVPGRFTLYDAGVGPGSSGSPVLNQDRQLGGMITQLDPIQTFCIQAAILLNACQQWQAPTNLMTGESPSVFTFDADPQPGDDKPVPGPDLLIPRMERIPGGSFVMGSNEGDEDEKPTHRVQVPTFYLGTYEVTVAEFEAFVLASGYQTDAEKGDGSLIFSVEDGKWVDKAGIYWKHDAQGELRPRSEYNHPVIHVSWNDAQAYCAWLSEQTGQTYRLPTEAEWEYAAGNGRAHTRYSWGNGEPKGKTGGNVRDESKDPQGRGWNPKFEGYDDGYFFTAPVGQFDPNDFGLHDLSGNVWEWCQDWYHRSYEGAPTDGSAWEDPKGSYRVLRGGSWGNGPQDLRVAYRNHSGPTDRSYYFGFRLARTP